MSAAAPPPHSGTDLVRVLIADGFDSAAADALREAGCDVIHNPMLSSSTLAGAIRDVQPEALVVRGMAVDAQAMAASPRLALIVCAASDTEGVEVEAASRSGIRVAHCPGRNAAAVAELAWGLIIACDRRIPDQVADLRAGRADRSRYSEATGLSGRTLGIVGLGQVGQETARRGLAFGMHVVAWSRNITEDRCDALGVDYCSNLVNLAKLSDVVSVSVTGSDETRGLLSDKFFNALRPGTIVVNTSRGSVCDERALLQAVRTRGIRAGLDVFPGAEGAGHGSALAALATEPGVYGTCEVGEWTEQARLAIDAEVVRILRSWLADGRAPHCVNLAEHTAAAGLLQVRHVNRPGVLARIFDTLGRANINVEEMDNQISAGGEAAIARVFVSPAPTPATVDAVRACPHVLGVTFSAVRRPS